MIQFSIVIPVRNAVAYVPDAVRSALRGGGPHAEIIISDNHSSDGSFEVLRREFGGIDQVRLVRPDTALSMTAHFNFALALASGEYVSIIGADDGVMPYFSQAMANLTRSQPATDAFISPRAYYFWPGVEGQYGNRSLLMHGRAGVRTLSPKREYERALSGRINYAESLQMYAGSVVSRRLIERVRRADPDGLFYRGTQPDMYSTFALLSHTAEVVRTNFPLHWTGSSPASNGYQHATPSSDETRTRDFWELADASDDPTTSEFDHGRDTPVPLLVVDAAIRARRIHPLAGHRELSRAEIERALAGAFVRTQEKYRELVLDTSRRFSPPVRLSRSATSLRTTEIAAERVSTVLERRTSRLFGGILLNDDAQTGARCATLGDADDLVAGSGFSPG